MQPSVQSERRLGVAVTRAVGGAAGGAGGLGAAAVWSQSSLLGLVDMSGQVITVDGRWEMGDGISGGWLPITRDEGDGWVGLDHGTGELVPVTCYSSTWG